MREREYSTRTMKALIHRGFTKIPMIAFTQRGIAVLFVSGFSVSYAVNYLSISVSTLSATTFKYMRALYFAHDVLFKGEKLFLSIIEE